MWHWNWLFLEKDGSFQNGFVLIWKGGVHSLKIHCLFLKWYSSFKTSFEYHSRLIETNNVDDIIVHWWNIIIRKWYFSKLALSCCRCIHQNSMKMVEKKLIVLFCGYYLVFRCPSYFSLTASMSSQCHLGTWPKIDTAIKGFITDIKWQFSGLFRYCRLLLFALMLWVVNFNAHARVFLVYVVPTSENTIDFASDLLTVQIWMIWILLKQCKSEVRLIPPTQWKPPPRCGGTQPHVAECAMAANMSLDPPTSPTPGSGCRIHCTVFPPDIIPSHQALRGSGPNTCQTCVCIFHAVKESCGVGQMEQY